MKVVLFVLDEPVYIPATLEILAERLGSQISCIIAFPPSRRSGKIATIKRHIQFLGASGTCVLGWRALKRRLPFGSERHVRSIDMVGRRHGIPTLRSKRVDDDVTRDALARHPADLLLSVSCPQMIGAEIRGRFSRGALNVHAAPLPRYRGLMPSFWILANGETSTAVTVHDLVDALDAGEILVQREIEIAPNETWDSLLRKTKSAGALAALEAIRQIEAGTVTRKPNPDADATRFGFPTAKDAREFRARGGRMV